MVKKMFYSFIVKIGKRKERKKFSQSPIFIGGCGRSGTTLLLSILSAHNDLFAFKNELCVFENNKDKIRLDRLYRTLIISKINKSAKRWCEKSPINIRYINVISEFYNNNFKFIQIVRDGRDVILSKHPKNSQKYWVSVDRWINDVSIGMKYSENKNVYTIKYEDLIFDYENTIKKVCDFLDLSLTPEILNWHKFAKVRKNRAYFSEVQKLSQNSIGKWKDPKNKQRVEELLNEPKAVELLKFYNYM